MSAPVKNIPITGTPQTDPRSGGLKRSSGVNVLPIVAETWEEVRDNNNSAVDWLIAGYVENSKTDITVLAKGNGGVAECAKQLPESEPCFGGCKMKSSRFKQQFYYAPEQCSAMKKGRASMHKNGAFNAMEGCDGEFNMNPNLVDSDM